MADDMSPTDWISAAASIVAAVIAIVTLVTVYVGAIQLLSQSRMYRRGLSWRSIGPWQPIVAKWALFGLQRRISAPVVSLKTLVDKKWQPNLEFPLGFPISKNECVEKGAEKVEAHASWVNFMQALGLSPANSDLYEVQDASELVNGMVPMSWKGKDLSGICSILGFQSCEATPSFKDPMPIPMQWSGPLGWLQFREGTHGCVAEFRRRMVLGNQISSHLHTHPLMRARELKNEPYSLRMRLWNSINGIVLNDKESLYIGGTDRHKRPQEVEEEVQQTSGELSHDLTEKDLSDEEILRRLFGKKDERPKAVRREAERNDQTAPKRTMGRDGDMPDFLDSILRDKLDASKQKQVLRPCPGLLSISVQGELAYSRGLISETCHEYDRKYTDAEDVDHAKYPYNLGDLYMGLGLLRLVKTAMLLLQPDGYYFSCTYFLLRDIGEIYEHVEEQSNVLGEVFPGPVLSSIKTQNFEGRDKLMFAMELCNDLQRTRKTARACFTVEDMRLIAKTSSMSRDLLTGDSTSKSRLDLVWALLFYRNLVPKMLKAFKKDNFDFNKFLHAKVSCRNGKFDCSGLFYPEGDKDDLMDELIYDAVCIDDGEFSGTQMVTALCVVFIMFYWISSSWVTDVSAYDATLPQTVLMC